MSQLVGSASWGRDNHDSTSGAGSLRSSRLRARRFPPGSNRSFYEARSSHPEYPSSSGEPLSSCVGFNPYGPFLNSSGIPSGPKIRRLRAPSKAVLKPRAAADAQTSLTLDPSVVVSGFKNNGQVEGSSQSGSLTSSNNFINFCATTKLPLTNGTQVVTGSCNSAPMGLIPAVNRMPTSKFTYPRNGDILATNAPMTVGLAITNFASGNFANVQTNYLAAPQQLDSNGQIQGHAMVVIEEVAADPLTALDPRKFMFFKGLTGVADSTGVLTTEVTEGLPAGFYRATTTNGNPALLPTLQHGAVDDAIYVNML
ncbi:hypothetical protein DFH08DRAFT_690815 [Mycena albidolilacea]|uniref:Uncharacterized protein n=1 Tax=Mycena albidolilacea TaxID=1033008 RepID=A0AAD7ADQ5_9AGAR|nr:hypothetical protein DFH08DRAFT_690815 [Mycena albidolilacea]